MISVKYRVIIVDDEPKIVQLIKTLGHWEQYEIEIIDECLDGSKALQSIIDNKPDLVLSDIKMPEVDGIELIQEARKHGVESLFILLSGYRHFEYARSAIALNVLDYLLKPIDEEQLNKTLEKACYQLEQRQNQRENELEFSKIKLEQTKNKMKDFWERLISCDNIELPTDLLSEEIFNKKYGTNFHENCYQVLTMVSNLSGMLQNQYSLFTDETERVITQCFDGIAVCYCHMTYMGHIIILNYDEADKKQVREAVSAMYYRISNLSEVYGKFRLNIGTSNIKNSLKDMQEAFTEAHSAEWGRLIMMRNGVLDYRQIASLTYIPKDGIYSKTELEKVKECVKFLRKEELGDLFSAFYQRAVTFQNNNPKDMIMLFSYLMLEIVDGAVENHQQTLCENVYYAYLEAKNFPQVIKNTYLQVENYILEQQRMLKEKLAKPIAEAVKYVKTNYAEQISLENVAEASNVSPSYLSKLFKEEMDMGFTEFLTQVRLEAAQKFLEESSLSIKEIAIEVGYPDEKYFSKLFKKITGMKPSEYRKIYG